MSGTFDDARRALANGRTAEALRIASDLVARNPRDERAVRLRAMLCTETGSFDADTAWQRVLELAPGDPEAHYALGQAAGDCGNFAAAAAHFRAALVRAPAHPQLLASLGLALEETGEQGEAEAAFRAALTHAREADPQLIAHLARNLFRQRRYGEALAHFDDIHRRTGLPHPSLGAAYGVCLAHAGRDADAEAAFRRALAQDPRAAPLRRDFAAFLMRRERYAEAAAVLDEAGAPDDADLLATTMLLACRLHLADWHDFDALRARVVARVAAGLATETDIVPAFDFLAVCDDPALQAEAARSWARGESAQVAARVPAARAARTRLRLGFVSSDFGNHPVGRLVVNLFERLDRARFEVLAYITADEPREPFRQRIERAVDRFAVLDRRDAGACARALAAADIDVLFDLNGYSGGEALRIFAQRPALLQVNFLGYTGTLGSPAYDFIVADDYCIPVALAGSYSERVLRIAPCYLPSDSLRLPDAPAPERATYGLPRNAVVLCAFAATYKIVPDMFDVWMSLLRDVPGSVLWLRHLPDDRIARLRRAAVERGIDGARLVVAPGESIPRYLARFALADLFVDSAPFGSHTTVNDALFSGLPVVTIKGGSFAGRASASQVAAAGLPELIADSLQEYRAIAGALAADRARLDALTQRLRAGRAHSPLFDMEAYTRGFETAIADAVATSRSECRGS